MTASEIQVKRHF